MKPEEYRRSLGGNGRDCAGPGPPNAAKLCAQQTGGGRCRSLVVSSSSLAGVSPVRVAARRPGSRLAAWSGNGSGRSPASKALMGERLSGP